MLQKWHKNFGNFGLEFAVQGLIPWPYFRMKHTKIDIHGKKTDKNVKESLILYRFSNTSTH